MEKSSDSKFKNERDEIALLQRRLARESKARKLAEELLEQKSTELYERNQELNHLNNRLEGKVIDQANQVQALNDFGSALIGKNDLTEIAKIITTKVMDRLGFEDCVIYSVDDGVCKQIAAHGLKNDNDNGVINPILIPVGKGIVGSVAKTGKYEIVPFARNDPRYIEDMNPAGSELTVPIVFEGRVIGVIDSESSEENFYTQDHAETLSTIANLVSIFFQNGINSQRNEELKKNINSQNEFLNTVIKNIHSGLLLNDENGKIRVINDEFKRVFRVNISDDELIGMDQLKSAHMVKHLFNEPEKFIEFVDYGRRYNQKLQINEISMKDGSIIEIIFIPVYSNSIFTGHLWQVTDITIERLAQKEIAKSEEKYRGIIENMELGLLEVDLDHKILRAYEWFCDMTGYKESELIGKDARNVFLVEGIQSPQMQEQDVLRKEGKQGIYELIMKKKSGEEMYVMISGAPIYDQNEQVVGSIGIHYDITDRKRLEVDLLTAKEEAEKAQESEKIFLANMSHEIRNPLNAIIGLTNLLYDTNPSEQQLSHLNGLKNSSDLLMGLISGILDISKIESGNLDLLEENVDISAVIDGLINVTSFNVDKPIEIVNQIEQSNSFVAYADATVINQIFLNLIGNALKFTEQGIISISGSLLEERADKKVFQFSVADTGIGIKKDHLEDIFKSFKQASSQTKLKYGGTGLGLSIVKNLVELYGGKIDVESQFGKGTTFTFTLELGAPINQSKIESIKKYKSSGEGNVLIVEDNKVNQQYLSSILDNWSIDYKCADNGKEALKLLKTAQFSLILMDIRMPEMDGYETTIRIRSNKDGKNYATPIVALTASALVDEKEKAISAGMNDHMTKPFSAQSLAQVISNYGLLTEVDSEDAVIAVHGSVLDTNYLNELYEGDQQRMLAMMRLFVKVMPGEFELLLAHFENSDHNSFKKQAHKMKPNFGMVGLVSLQTQMEELEHSDSLGVVDIDSVKSAFQFGKELVASEIERLHA